MKLFTSLKNLVAYSLVLLVTVCGLLLTPPNALAVSVDFGATQYLAFDAGTQTQDVDAAIASYRSLKGKVSKNETLTTDEVKGALGVINAKINAAVQEKKDVLAADPSASTESFDSSIASYRSLKGKVSKNETLTIDETKDVLKAINSKINALVQEKKA
ncbi:NAD(P)H-quinone oxidoreductase subunit 4 [Nostoc sp. FACHB-87]|uniref:NAD(P)H-quinone oxidoreductase subunit 4 n=2 Tax=Cyanophyceae TaxID=3028117 RepID=UPI00168721EE|nr:MULTISPECIES: NAD(P)H-quinone oxidoreductase subunit 4 [Nostocales]MBD2299923.1 NAD(P)H-quinone oxidoreductase subunit 4 [Nostoc sp. FACHB-190]MBD2456917.1 NAD(P)H-quinone oxidoreductase subunit 4 [Nostoc sp. FACHB-87]MBD2478769.1 NAD(P)H-quinone oxidoreductase subunit 4 [Anabaena sp. FACHB-83]MBD2491327.1 NAD(P)H-quinone oxidoreductase subunit 4 [Aulosira sp. FACHB-615]